MSFICNCCRIIQKSLATEGTTAAISHTHVLTFQKSLVKQISATGFCKGFFSDVSIRQGSPVGSVDLCVDWVVGVSGGEDAVVRVGKDGGQGHETRALWPVEHLGLLHKSTNNVMKQINTSKYILYWPEWYHSF